MCILPPFMHVLSVDIGIKNLSFCLFRVSKSSESTDVQVVEWQNVNLATEDNGCRVSLVMVGRNLQRQLDAWLSPFGNHPLELAVIENQIGPLANRMKTVQGMVIQYLIMRYDSIRVECVSACHKLKHFLTQPSSVPVATYAQRKRAGKHICKHWLEQLEPGTEGRWRRHFATHAKKDDLADCFLQGLWFIQQKM